MGDESPQATPGAKAAAVRAGKAVIEFLGRIPAFWLPFASVSSESRVRAAFLFLGGNYAWSRSTNF
jgi:hypothetical protein